MIINFNFTRQNQHNEVEYFNSRGQSIKSYDLWPLKEFVSDLIGSKDAEEINLYLDDNWIEVTTDFYNSVN